MDHSQDIEKTKEWKVAENFYYYYLNEAIEALTPSTPR